MTEQRFVWLVTQGRRARADIDTTMRFEATGLEVFAPWVPDTPFRVNLPDPLKKLIRRAAEKKEIARAERKAERKRKRKAQRKGRS